MKRFLSIILTAAMLMSATPAVFAENNAVDESVIVAERLTTENQEEITEKVTENVTEDVSEEISGEGEENSEEQISLMSEENNISLQANGTDEVQYSTDGSTWTSSSLSGAVTAIGESSGTIKVLRDITVSSKIEIAGNITLVANDKDITITRAGTLTGVPVISVASGATLNLGTQTVMENTLTIDGGAIWNDNDGYPNTDAAQSTDKSNNAGVRGDFAIIRTEGTFNMYENVILQNNHNNTSDAANHSGGGVDIENAGVFNMHGGKIWKCSSASQAEWGGGVTVAGLDDELKTSATFNLYGGEICYNSAGIGGGVSVGNPNSSHAHPAIFNMYNGKIHHNKVGSMYVYSGAGVYVADNAVFTMEDGSITDNTAETKNGYALGGGVESVGTFNMNGGTISGNTAKHGGAGIFLMYNNNVNCEANITGGNIINNNGEGIFINDTKAYLNISGNVNISGNTTTGIYIEKDASPINVAKILTVENTINVDSAITDDGTVIVTFEDGLNASDYTNAFEHASKSMIVKENKLVIGVRTYTVTVTDPSCMMGSLGTIKISGADDLTAVPVKTELTLSIENENVAIKANHSFVKWVVKTESGTEIAVTDNKFIMPSENVAVTAEYMPNIKMVFYAGGTYASDTNECTDCTWNKDGSITYTMPNNKGTLTISTPNGFKQWIYPTDTETKTPVVTANDVVTVTVNTNEGYMFNGIKSVTDQYEKLTGTFNNSGTYTFSVPAGTYESYKGEQTAFIILDITKQQYSITKSYNSNEGSVQVVYKNDPDTEISKAYWGSSIWIGVEPKENYKIKAVKVIDKDNNEVSLDTKYAEQYKTWEFVMPKNDVTVSVEFELDACGITIAPCEYGTVTTNPSGTATVGSEVTITATPDTNYELDTLTVTTASGATVTVADNKFTMPSESVTIKAVFVKSKFDVTVEETENGTVSCDEKDKKVDWGTEIDFTVKPDDYYDIDTVTVNGNKVTPDADGNYKFTSEAEDSTIKATFKKQQFALTDATTETNGTVSIMSGSTDVNKQKLDWGTSVTVTVAPKDNWEIDKVTINGKDISEFKDTVLHTMSLLSANAPTTYTVLIPTYDAELVVTYKKQQFGVTASATTNGTIDLLTESPLNWGENFTINVQADPHYEIDIVTVDGKTVTVNEQGDYTFEMPAHDVTVSATFKKVKYTITGIGDHATFSIPSSDTYNWGDTVEFTVTPDKWYNIKSVYADNSTVVITPVANKENTYSFTMPQGNVVITTVTERPNFTVTFDSKGGSNITPKTVANGDAADKPGVPVWAGRGFAGWYTDESCTQKYDFTAPVTENITLYARWFLWGDVNNDGTVDSYDALLIRRCRAGLTDYSLIENRLAGFVNGFETGRNYPDSGDAVSIRRFRAGLINRYKVEDGAAGYEFDLENNTYIPKN